MQIKPKLLLDKLQRNELSNGLLLFGDEPRQKLEITDNIRRVAQTQGYTEKHQFTADSEFDWGQLEIAANTMSLFADKQLIELHLPTGKPGTTGAQALIKFAEQTYPDVFLLLHGPQINQNTKNAKWFKRLNARFELCQCYELKGPQLQAYLQAYAKKIALDIDAEGINLIGDFNEGNLLAATQELDKLSLGYKDNTQISAEMVKSALVQQSRFSVFEYTDCLLANNMTKSIKILQRLEEEGIEPNVVLWQLINEYQRLLSCKEQLQQTGRINFNQLRIWQNKQSLYTSTVSRLNNEAMYQLQKQLSKADKLFKSSVPEKPFVIIAHLSLLFMPAKLDTFEFS